MKTEKEHAKIRYAVIGAGNIAQVAALPAFKHARENSELVAIISGDAEKREELSKRYDVELTGSYDDLEKVLRAAKVDAAYIGVPNHLHRAITERCAAAGVHILCEKPMAMSVHDCEQMIHAARSHKVKLMIAYRLHFEEANLRAIDLIKRGEIGEPRFFSSVFSHSVREGDIRTQAEAGGGALYDLGPYCINAARHLFQSEPTEVFAYQVFGTDERFKEVDEMTCAILRFPGDRVAQFIVNQGVASTSEFRVVGTEGNLRVDPAYDYKSALMHHLTIGEGKTKEHSYSKRDQFAPELVYFSNCIQRDIEPEPSGAEGIADVRVLAAIVESFQTHAPVAIHSAPRSKQPDMSQNIEKAPIREPKTVNAPSPSLPK